MRFGLHKNRHLSYKAKSRIYRNKCGFGIYMAEWTGLEPATPGVTGRYSNQLNYRCTYTMSLLWQTIHQELKVAQRTGLEPATPGVTGRYSNRLNYRCAKHRVVGDDGIEPPTLCL